MIKNKASSGRNIHIQEIFDDDNDQYDCDSKYCEFNITTLLFKFIMIVQRPTTIHNNCNVIVHVFGHLRT